MARFDSFVILAAMRTGSNLLEAALNALAGVTCHGEAFNPALIGYPKRDTLLGMSLAERDADPLVLWQRIGAEPGLNGCRYFPDHDPRVLGAMLDDPRCAKIVLNRNPLESYVSLKIARATGQWRLADARHRIAALATFDAAEYAAHLETLQQFQLRVLHALQTSGQTAFYLDYEDVPDLSVLNGLAQWLGVDARLDTLSSKLVPQNPEPLEDKVSNPAAMEAALACLDHFNLARTPNFEPRRGPNVPGFMALRGGGLLFMPIRPAPEAAIRAWLEQLGEVEDGFSQKTLRQWKRRHPGHRSFTVLRHPLLRAHQAFCTLLEAPGFEETRRVLTKSYKMKLDDHGPAFLAWLRWLKPHLGGQTKLPVQPLWASQSNMVQSISQIGAPDLLAREDRLAEDLTYLAGAAGLEIPAFTASDPDSGPVKLADIWQPEMEKAAREAYPRDFLQFGFGDWRA
ncbi:nodulation protein NodH [Sedimentimonas flavescens]|uniref:nodulation protein NodH n=1 Tax=Sedimentimonas flavescens TaxID=2851012 RepID=UPI0021A51E73|nr:nodulation protein NodH [Sedimentimonas flavescens]MCT2541056.1 nodulation protein NodH [Sedimentimonas flavescens]